MQYSAQVELARLQEQLKNEVLQITKDANIQVQVAETAFDNGSAQLKSLLKNKPMEIQQELTKLEEAKNKLKEMENQIYNEQIQLELFLKNEPNELKEEREVRDVQVYQEKEFELDKLDRQIQEELDQIYKEDHEQLEEQK